MASFQTDGCELIERCKRIGHANTRETHGVGPAVTNGHGYSLSVALGVLFEETQRARLCLWQHSERGKLAGIEGGEARRGERLLGGGKHGGGGMSGKP